MFGGKYNAIVSVDLFSLPEVLKALLTEPPVSSCVSLIILFISPLSSYAILGEYKLCSAFLKFYVTFVLPPATPPPIPYLDKSISSVSFCGPAYLLCDT